MLNFLFSNRLTALGNDGKLLAGGSLQFYELGTTTPKKVYADVYGNSELTNPVVLNSVGEEQIYLNGSYTVVSYDHNNVQIGPPVDILGAANSYITSGGATFADNIIVSVNTYQDVRNLSNPYAYVFVQGRSLQADGGEGVFFYDSLATDSDDDGIILAPNMSSGRYRRMFFETINPQWFGLKYDLSENQTPYLSATEFAAIVHKLPIEINGSVYINQNHTVQSLVEYIFTDNAEVVSTLSVTFTFPTGSKLLSCGLEVWKNTVQPKFSDLTLDSLKYSWMYADNTLGKITKFLASVPTAQVISEIDLVISASDNFVAPSNYAIKFSNGGKINFYGSSPLNLTISNLLNKDNTLSAVSFEQSTTVGNISVSDYIHPEFFSAIGNGSANDYIPVKAAIKNTRVNLVNSYYTSGATISTNGLSLKGSLSNSLSLPSGSFPSSAINSKLIIGNTGTAISFPTSALLYVNHAAIIFGTSGIIDTSLGNIQIEQGIVSGTSGTALKCYAADIINSTISRKSAISATDPYNVKCAGVRLLDNANYWHRYYGEEIDINRLNVNDGVGTSATLAEFGSTGFIYRNDSHTTPSSSPNIIGNNASFSSLSVTSGINMGVGKLILGTKYVSSNYTYQLNDPAIIGVDTTGGNYTITLPTSAGVEGREVKIVNMAPGTNQVSIVASGSGFWYPSFTPVNIPTIVVQRPAATAIYINGRWAIA